MAKTCEGQYIRQRSAPTPPAPPSPGKVGSDLDVESEVVRPITCEPMLGERGASDENADPDTIRATPPATHQERNGSSPLESRTTPSAAATTPGNSAPPPMNTQRLSEWTHPQIRTNTHKKRRPQLLELTHAPNK